MRQVAIRSPSFWWWAWRLCALGVPACLPGGPGSLLHQACVRGWDRMERVSALRGTMGARSTGLLGAPAGTRGWRRLGRGRFRERQVCTECEEAGGQPVTGRNVPGPEREGGGEGDPRAIREGRPRLCKASLGSPPLPCLQDTPLSRVHPGSDTGP